MRWKVVSSSSIFSFPFPHFLSVQSNPFCFFFFTILNITKWFLMKKERKKEREKPLGSVRLVYSRTSLPAIFLFQYPLLSNYSLLSPLGCGLASYTKKKKQISLKIRIVFSLDSQFYEFVSVLEDSSTNQNLGISFYNYFATLLLFCSTLNLFYALCIFG